MYKGYIYYAPMHLIFLLLKTVACVKLSQLHVRACTTKSNILLWYSHLI